MQLATRGALDNRAEAIALHRSGCTRCASDALCSTLAVVATANRKLATAPREDQPGGLLEDLATFHEHLNGLFKELHELLSKIASFRANITGWSVTVGMSNTLTVNFTNRHAQAGSDSKIRG